MDFYNLLLTLVLVQDATASCSTYNCHSRGVNKRPRSFGFPVPVGEVTVAGVALSPSGLAHSRQYENVLYFVNDEGNTNIIYTLDALNAEVIGSITITNCTNVDWGDLAVGSCPTGISGSCIYVHDGGEAGRGPLQTIYIMKEPTDPATHTMADADKTITYQFQPGTNFIQAMSIFIDCRGTVYFFEALSYETHAKILYQIDVPDQATAEGLFKMTIPSTGTGPVAASISPDCSELLIKTPDKVFYVPVQWETIQDNRLQVLPYLPVPRENSIAWGLRQDRYYILAGKDPFLLTVAKRNHDGPTHKFGLGSTLGIIGKTKMNSINGLATSRNQPGFVYAITTFGTSEVLIIQLQGVLTTGVIKTGLSVPTGFTDIATGACISPFNATSCIYINSFQFRGKPTKEKVYMFEEPENLYGDTHLTIAPENTLAYDLPPGHTSPPVAIMIGSMGEIYVLDHGPTREPVTLFQIKINPGGTNSLVVMGNFTSPSLHDGPEAVDMSPCYNEIIVKFWDIVLLFDITSSTFAEAFDRGPTIEPYLPETQGFSVAFAGCDTYLTTAKRDSPTPLMSYSRI